MKRPSQVLVGRNFQSWNSRGPSFGAMVPVSGGGGMEQLVLK